MIYQLRESFFLFLKLWSTNFWRFFFLAGFSVPQIVILQLLQLLLASFLKIIFSSKYYGNFPQNLPEIFTKFRNSYEFHSQNVYILRKNHK